MLSVRRRWVLFFPLAFALVFASTLIQDAPSARGDDLAAFDVGNGHACAAVGGGLVCWGDNSRGQLGDGTTEDSAIPVEVVGIAGDVVSVAAGNFLTCAALASDEVKCWGYGPEGQLGTGDLARSSTPLSVSALDGVGVVALDAGVQHVCALTNEAAVFCWGWNGLGQVGLGADGFQTTPYAVPGLQEGVASIATGNYFTCAVLSSGRATCSRENRMGFEEITDQDGEPLTDIAQVSAGLHTCALHDDGTVSCGAASGWDSPSPIVDEQGGTLTGVSQIAATGHRSCALTAAGAVTCWQLERGEPGADRSFTSPEPVPGLSTGVEAIVGGQTRTCARLRDGSTKCWGFENAFDDGELHDAPSIVAGPPIGDANCDGVANSKDAAAILQYATDLVATLPCPKAADVDGDGELTSKDSALILQLVAGLLDELPL